VKSTAYRNTYTGGETSAYPGNVYGYTIPVNSSLTPSSITLPANNNVRVLGVQPNPAVTPYNVNAIYTNGKSFSSGADGDGYALSATLLGSTQVFNGTTFTYGPPDMLDAYSNVTIPVPASASFSTLKILGFAVNSSQAAQTFTVHYTNGTTSTATQSISDWCNPQSYTGETTVATMAYRNTSAGGENTTACYVYGYTIAVNSSLIVSGITLPANNSVIVLAVQPLALPYNVYAIYPNGTDFENGGADGYGHALSPTLLGASQVFNGTTFTYGPSSQLDAFNNVTIPLAPGSFSSLNLLGFAIGGSETSQTFKVNYTNGTYSTSTQNISDWCSPQGYSGETQVVTMSYLNTGTGGEYSGPCYVYGYTIPVTSSLTVSSITLPSDPGYGQGNSIFILLGVQDQQ